MPSVLSTKLNLNFACLLPGARTSWLTENIRLLCTPNGGPEEGGNDQQISVCVVNLTERKGRNAEVSFRVL